MMADDWLHWPLKRLRRYWRRRQHRQIAQELADQFHPLARFYRDSPAWMDSTSASDRFLVLDMETTGLSAPKNQILSLGWVLIDDGVIRLDTARHLLIRPEQPLDAENAVIHGITDQMAEAGCGLEEGLSTLLPDLAGRILVGHHVQFEQAFLNQACRQLWQIPLITPSIDTLALGMREYRRSGHTPQQGKLTLNALRAKLGLPRYRAHHALSDALATAELFLAFQVRNRWGVAQIQDLVD